MMRILIVAMTNSVHTARWVSQLERQGWDVHIINSAPQGSIDCHPKLKHVTVHGLRTWCRPSRNIPNRRFRGFNPLPAHRAGYQISRGLCLVGLRLFKSSLARKVAKLIDTLKPDVVHSLELQHSSYLVHEAQRFLRGPMPKWWVTNWGSDIYYFRHFDDQRAKIEEILSACDYYSCEVPRDVDLARELGFRGHVMHPVLPNTGGFDLRKLKRLWAPGPTSARRTIAIKGYQGLFGRAITAVKAVELCADVLRNYAVEIYSAMPDTVGAAKMAADRTRLSIQCHSGHLDHDQMLALHGRSRASIGLSISDGASTSFLEALSMGAFPIQSYSAEPQEYVVDGESGAIVDPDDPHQIAAALRRAVTDDEWVDEAAQINWRTACDRLDAEKIRPVVLQWYRDIVTQTEYQAEPRPELRIHGDAAQHRAA